MSSGEFVWMKMVPDSSAIYPRNCWFINNENCHLYCRKSKLHANMHQAFIFLKMSQVCVFWTEIWIFDVHDLDFLYLLYADGV